MNYLQVLVWEPWRLQARTTNSDKAEQFGSSNL